MLRGIEHINITYQAGLTGKGMVQINTIQLENFKAFKNSKCIKLAKINLVVGKNSAGKSSLVKSILGASQTARERKMDNSDFRLVGDLADLGTFKDTIHGKEENSKFSISFGIQAPNRRHDHVLTLKYTYKKGPRLVSATVSGIKAFVGKDLVCSAKGSYKNQNKFKLGMSGQVLSHTRIEDTSHIELNQPEVEIPEILRKLNQFIADERGADSETKEDVTKQVMVLNDMYIRIVQLVKYEKKDVWHTANTFSTDNDVLSEVSGASRAIDTILTNCVYIGPLRDEPSRSARLAVSSGNSSGKKGENLAVMLHSNLEDTDFKDKFNHYLKKLGIADGIITSESYLSVSKMDSKTGYINILLEKNGQYNTLVDVGFGTSQVLPVVFELMAQKNRLILIEQPELHLHPSAQAEIGDLLVDSMKRKNQLIVETHSVTLIERVRRLIREGKLDHKDVNIIYIQDNPEKRCSECKQIGFLSNGDFDSPWPERDFFGERAAEALSDWW